MEGLKQTRLKTNDHEDSDRPTLITFHARRIQHASILIRSSDTDVLVILIGFSGRHQNTQLVMDFGVGIHRRFINVSSIAKRLETIRCGLSEAVINFHALTGSDFTSAIYRIGKVRPLRQLLTEASESDISDLRSLTSTMDAPAITSFVCRLYGLRTSDINEARYKIFLRICGGKKANPLSKLKKLNCASLPPCEKVLTNHLKRTNYVARLWKRADEHVSTANDTLHTHVLYYRPTCT